MGSSVRDGSTQARFLRSVASNASSVALFSLAYAAVAVYAGRKSILAENKREAQKKEPNQPLVRKASTK
jgi:hypothetical protein